MGRQAVLFVILLWYQLLFIDIVVCTRNLLKEENLNTEMNPSEKFMNRTITGADLTRNVEVLEPTQMNPTNSLHTFLAIVRTKDGPNKYRGAQGFISIHHPKVAGQQYSASRIKIQGGSDSIEVGWRVDPSLYGDSLTRLYIRTDAGQTRCFNADCPGFIQTDPDFVMGKDLSPIITKPGVELWVLRCYIIKDMRSGNWNFYLQRTDRLIGYWPSKIFTGLAGLADKIEWGGIVNSPPGTPLPPMGSSNFPIGIRDWDGYISEIRVSDDRGQVVEIDTEAFADDPKRYSVIDVAHEGRHGHVVLYGGPRHPNV